MFACENNNQEIVNCLINNKINVNLYNGYGSTALIIVCENNN